MSLFSELIQAGLHWVGRGFQDIGKGFAAFAGRVGEVYQVGQILDREELRAFFQTVGRSAAAADMIGRGETPPDSVIPLIPDLPSSQKYVSEGVATVIAPELGEPGQPFKTTLPFRKESASVPTVEELTDSARNAMESEQAQIKYEAAKARRRAARRQLIRRRTRDIEYEITPMFIWRTH